jgi:hypothetical protein
MLTIRLSWKNALSVVTGVCVVGLAFISLHVAPDKLKDWQVWVYALAIVGILCILLQAFLQSQEDHQRDEKAKERDAREKNIDATLLSIQVQMSGKTESPLVNDASSDSRVPFSPDEHLRHAQDAVWLQDIVKMPMDELKIAIGHDSDFRHKFDTITSNNTQFEAIRNSLAKEPIIAARFIRSRLVPREPFAQQIREVYGLMNKPFTSTSDFLFEISLVNITDNPTTIDRIITEAEIEGKWVSLKMGDLSNYEIAFDEEGEGQSSPFIRGITARVEQLLPNLWGEVKDVPLTRGIAKRGWIDFAVEMPSAQIDKPIQHRVRIVDALGGIHPVVVLENQPLDESGRIKHSKKVYDRIRQQ